MWMRYMYQYTNYYNLLHTFYYDTSKKKKENRCHKSIQRIMRLGITFFFYQLHNLKYLVSIYKNVNFIHHEHNTLIRMWRNNKLLTIKIQRFVHFSIPFLRRVSGKNFIEKIIWKMFLFLVFFCSWTICVCKLYVFHQPSNAV